MRIVDFLVFALSGLVILADEVQAYIDPGAGSMVLQAILAALIGIGVFVRQARISIAAFFKRMAGKFSGKAADE